MTPTPGEQPKDHRRIKRRVVKKGTTVTCRKGTLGLGVNLGVRVQDVSEEGVKLLVKSALAKGDEIEVALTPPGFSRAIMRVAVVTWCSAKTDEGFWIGAKFRSALAYSEMFHMI